MQIKKLGLIICLIFFIISGLHAGQENYANNETNKSVVIKPGLDFEYFTQQVDLDEDEADADLTVYLFKLNCEFEFQGGLFLTLNLGYTLSDYKSMTFRGLPISVELDVGGVSGYLFGGSIRKSFALSGDFEIEGHGDFVYNYGIEKSWPVPGLSVQGEVTGKPTWMRIMVGPRVSYRGFNALVPYASLNFYRFWGTFTLDQTIEELTGQEEKKMAGKNFINAILGTEYSLSDSFQIKGQLELRPHSDIDFGFLVGFRYVF
ncbi:MAG: autotransporter domain-containing protein [Candidatus Aminicenantes bacterium]|nr:autotransporter domain-containing protein [Candidatus Aminicenantes bacterium]